jgi:hypothetical protein
MDYYNREDNDCSDKNITISRALYDSYRTSDMFGLLLNNYLNKVRDGEMELDFKIIDLINETLI